MLMAFSAQAGDVSTGKAKSEGCAQCHGGNGKDDPPIAGMAEADFIKAMKDYQSGQRKNKKMAKAANGLTDADIADLAAYYATLK
jgi:cytochrome c553